MKNQQVATIVIAVAIIGILLGSLLALLLTPFLDQSQLMIALAGLAFLLMAVAFVVGPLLKGYFSAPGRLIEDIQIMVTANPAHRISIKEAPGNLN